jgi:hypothetical protein
MKRYFDLFLLCLHDVTKRKVEATSANFQGITKFNPSFHDQMQCEEGGHLAVDGSESDDIEVDEGSSIGSKNSDVDSDAEEGAGNPTHRTDNLRLPCLRDLRNMKAKLVI